MFPHLTSPAIKWKYLGSRKVSFERGVAQLASALASGARGRGFEPRRPDFSVTSFLGGNDVVKRLFLVLLFSASAFSFPHLDEILYPVWDEFDPNKIVVEDPNVEVYAELPSGDVKLKNYRASYEVIAKYSSLHGLTGGDLKNVELAPDCTNAEVAALKLWTTNDIYLDVNKALRYGQKGKVNGVPITEKTESEALLIASALNCVPQYEGLVTRLENTPPVILAQYQKGNYLVARGFTSTTKGNDVSDSFAAFFSTYKQRIRYGVVKAADIDRLGLSQWPGEKEVMFRPGTVFKVIDRKDVPPPERFTNQMQFETVR